MIQLGEEREKEREGEGERASTMRGLQREAAAAAAEGKCVRLRQKKNCAAVAINKPRVGRIKKEKKGEKKREKKPRLEIKALSQFSFRRRLLLHILLLFLGLSCFPSPFQQPPKNTWHRRLFTTKEEQGRIFFFLPFSNFFLPFLPSPKMSS